MKTRGLRAVERMVKVTRVAMRRVSGYVPAPSLNNDILVGRWLKLGDANQFMKCLFVQHGGNKLESERLKIKTKM